MSFCRLAAAATPYLFAALTLTPLTGCGGSGASFAGVEGTGGSQQGDVSGFSSIVVNGEAIDVTRAEIAVNGEPASEFDIKVGHIVKIETRADGSASRVTADRHLDGPLESVDFAAGTAESLNQAIRVTATTRFENTTFTADDDSPRGVLNPADNDLIAVSGYLDADDVLVATLFRRSATSYSRSSTPFDLNGTVSRLSTANSEFMLGELRVRFDNAAIVGDLAEGAAVEVIGTQPQANAALDASQVTVFAEAENIIGSNAALSGFIEEASNGLQFVIDGISINAETAERGDSSSDSNSATVTRNSFVRVNGRFIGANQIEAASFTVVPVSGVSYTSNASVENNQLRLYNLIAENSSTTIFQDKSATALRTFKATDINDGEKINVTGYFDRDQRLTATVIERLNSNATDIIRGTVESCSAFANSITIAKVTVNVDSNTAYRNQQGEPFTTMAEFCTAATNITATASGTVASTTSLNANIIQLSR